MHPEVAYLEVAMRIAALLLAVALTAVPGVAQEVETAESVAAAAAEPATEVAETPSPQRFSLDLELAFENDDDRDGVFDAASVLRIRSEREYRALLWSDPLARVRYNMAAEQAMLGREGLVHGGHMVGIGLGNAVIGDGSRSGVGLLLDGRAWGEMTGAERAQAGFDLALTAGILWALIDGLN